MRFLVAETTKSASGYANYVKEYPTLDKAQKEFHRFLGQMTDEPTVLYCMASIIDEIGDSVIRGSWYSPSELAKSKADTNTDTNTNTEVNVDE